MIEKIDPRLKLLLAIAFTGFTLLAHSHILVIYDYALIILLIFLSRYYLMGIKVIVYILTLSLITVLCGDYLAEKYQAITYVIEFVIRFSIFFIMGVWVSRSIKTGDFITSLEKTYVPKGIIITLAVMFRYFPTVKDEFYYIRNTMKLRQIDFSLKNIVLHPINTMEYSIVPLVIRLMTIADELSASAMTRGLDLKSKRIAYKEVGIDAIQVLITAVFIAALVFGEIGKGAIEGILS